MSAESIHQAFFSFSDHSLAAASLLEVIQSSKNGALADPSGFGDRHHRAGRLKLPQPVDASIFLQDLLARLNEDSIATA